MQEYFKASIILLTIGFTSSSIIQKDSIGITNIKNQQIFLFESGQCASSAQYSFTNTSTVDAKILSVFLNGMWQIRRCEKGSSAPEDDCHIIITAPTSTCKSFQAFSNGEETASVTRYGNEDTSVSELVVFSGGNFLGDSHLIPAEGVATTSITSGMSYVFTGPTSWALYSEPNFTGEVTCLEPIETIKTNGYGISYNVYAKMPLSFKSAQPGGACETSEIPSSTEGDTGGSSSFHNFSSAINFIGLIVAFISAKF